MDAATSSKEIAFLVPGSGMNQSKSANNILSWISINLGEFKLKLFWPHISDNDLFYDVDQNLLYNNT